MMFFLTVNGWSYHVNMDKTNINETNDVIGIEFEFDKDKKSIECVSYNNSFYRRSNACGVIYKWKILNITTDNYYTLKMGVVSGYKNDISPYLIPSYVIKFDKTSFEFGVFPNVGIFLIKINF